LNIFKTFIKTGQKLNSFFIFADVESFIIALGKQNILVIFQTQVVLYQNKNK